MGELAVSSRIQLTTGRIACIKVFLAENEDVADPQDDPIASNLSSIDDSTIRPSWKRDTAMLPHRPTTGIHTYRDTHESSSALNQLLVLENNGNLREPVAANRLESLRSHAKHSIVQRIQEADSTLQGTVLTLVYITHGGRFVDNFFHRKERGAPLQRDN